MHGKDAAWQRFAEADWAAARDAFAAMLERDPDDPEALDGLGQALWWLGERDAGIDRRREAFAAYRRRGDARGAGRLATYLAGEHRIDGRDAASAGWLSRARRLLDGAGTIPESGWLAIEEAKRSEDPAVAERHARAALDVAHELADPDVECMALAQVGRAVVRQGRVDEGMALLDEAMTVALGGEANDPLACGDACCTTLVVCDGLADLDRAAQWCEAVVEFTERRRYTPVQSWCRGIYGAVLVRSGEWERAEAVLAEALRREADRRRGGGRALPLAVLAELRLRQGRSEEAGRLLGGLDDEPTATWSRRRPCSPAARPQPAATSRRRPPSWRTRSAASARCASRSRRRAHGWRSRAPSPPPAHRSRSRARARRATRWSGSARAATPTRPARCCARSAPPAARRCAAGATT